MQITYDPDVDILYVVVRDAPPVDAVEDPPGTIISYGEDGEPVSIEFLDASDRGLVDGDELSVTVRAGSPKKTAIQ